MHSTVALGDVTLSAAELARIGKLKASLVNIRGRWVLVDAEEIRRALERLKRGASREVTLRDAVGGAAVGDIPAGTIIEGDDAVEDVVARVRGDRALTRVALFDRKHPSENYVLRAGAAKSAA